MILGREKKTPPVGGALGFRACCLWSVAGEYGDGFGGLAVGVVDIEVLMGSVARIEERPVAVVVVVPGPRDDGLDMLAVDEDRGCLGVELAALLGGEGDHLIGRDGMVRIEVGGVGSGFGGLRDEAGSGDDGERGDGEDDTGFDQGLDSHGFGLLCLFAS